MNSAALSLAASMFEVNASDHDNISDTATNVHLLGLQYRTPNDSFAVLEDVVSKFWFTYRTGFSSIGSSSGPTKDTGWGCMIRCGQMMLAEAYIRLFFPAGRRFRWRPNITDPIYWEILNMFIDKRHSSYSIHQIVQMGNSEGKEIGQWFGPNTIAQVLKRISGHEIDRPINVHVAMDNTIVIDDIIKLSLSNSKCTKSNKNAADQQNSWKPLVIIIPLRLGLNNVNPEYIDQIKLCFRLPQTLGFIGGKPNHAHYFIGYLDTEELLYLDPHVTQQYIDTTVTADDISYHSDRVNRMKFSALDPSLALGFACRTEADFNDLITKLRQKLPSKPMFEICQTNPFNLSNRDAHHHGVLTLDSDDDYELV